MLKPDDVIGKESFLLLIKRSLVKSFVFYDNIKDVRERLVNITGNLDSIELYRGILTKATKIPNEVATQTDILVFTPKGTSIVTCDIISCSTIKYAQKLIPLLIDKRVPLEDPDRIELLEDTATIHEAKSIENIYIFYGESVELHLSFFETDFDKDCMEECKKIYEVVKA